MRIALLTCVFIAFGVLTSCGSSVTHMQPVNPRTIAADPAPDRSPAPSPLSPATAQEPPVKSSAVLADVVVATGYEGLLAILDPKPPALFVSSPEFLDTRLPPASTFKVLDSLIALQTGVADGPNYRIKWDGKERSVPAWNQDQTLASAYKTSAEWYFQDLARRIGAPTMEKWVKATHYGNENIAGPIDAFWLEGELRISPREQLQFLQRLHARDLPFSPQVMDTFIRDIALWNEGQGWTIRGKTGWAHREDLPPSQAHVGWFIGWLETDAEVQYFAAVLLASEDTVKSRTLKDFLHRRIWVVLEGLMRQGLVSSWPEELLLGSNLKLETTPKLYRANSHSKACARRSKSASVL